MAFGGVPPPITARPAKVSKCPWGTEARVAAPSRGTRMALPQRPPGAPFTFPYADLTVRPWAPADRDGAAAVIRESLASYGLGWEPDGADADAIRVEEHYAGLNEEFWVVVEQDGVTVVGTAAFKRWDRSPRDCAEIRKMYLAPRARDIGLGSWLLDACEERARQLGFKFATLETASALREAVLLYERRGYAPIPEVDTARCDVAMRKTLHRARAVAGGGAPERVACVDCAGHVVSSTVRSKARERRLLYAGIVVLVLSQDGERIFVQRRSMGKSDYPGALDPFVAGGVSADDGSLLAASHRELREELGLDGAQFAWTPLWDGLHLYDSGVGDRCCFTGFIARATCADSLLAMKFMDGEVDGGMWMNRAQVDAAHLPSPVWKFVSRQERPPGMTCRFFQAAQVNAS
jgi:putative acetyltransferase